MLLNTDSIEPKKKNGCFARLLKGEGVRKIPMTPTSSFGDSGLSTDRYPPPRTLVPNPNTGEDYPDVPDTLSPYSGYTDVPDSQSPESQGKLGIVTDSYYNQSPCSSHNGRF